MKMIALAAGGIAPDIMVLSRYYLPSFAHSGIIQPIDQWLAKDKFDIKRDVSEIASGSWNGQHYGIPIWGGPCILMLNADLFEMQGLPLPSDLARRRDWTWDRLIEVGKKVTKDTSGDGTKDTFALSAPSAWEPVSMAT